MSDTEEKLLEPGDVVGNSTVLSVGKARADGLGWRPVVAVEYKGVERRIFVLGLNPQIKASVIARSVMSWERQTDREREALIASAG